MVQLEGMSLRKADRAGSRAIPIYPFQTKPTRCCLNIFAKVGRPVRLKPSSLQNNCVIVRHFRFSKLAVPVWFELEEPSSPHKSRAPSEGKRALEWKTSVATVGRSRLFHRGCRWPLWHVMGRAVRVLATEPIYQSSIPLTETFRRRTILA